MNAKVTVSTVGYSVGALSIPGYELPWEETPSGRGLLTIEIGTSNGDIPNGERREYLKPIMFSGGVGQLDDRHLHKGQPEKDMLVVKVGGPAYRIGLGGGAASSRMQDASQAALDFDAVQRGDAEMENKMNRVIRAAIERRGENPIVSIHDQGAGGNGNVLKEISAPNGAEIDIRNMVVGDPTMSVKEVWGAEFQENDAMLIREKDRAFLEAVGERENVPVMVMGKITDTGRMVVKDSKTGETAVDLDLELVLGELPKKTFVDHHVPAVLKPLVLPEQLTVMQALDRVLRLLSVGSKRFLTSKVDRSVTGLIARQQCCGPLHLPLSDVAVFAQSPFSTTGCATAIGEQPVKGLIDPAAMGRLTVGEACTNLVWAAITDIEDVKCSGNWMWASKLEGEGAAMYDCCEAMGKAMLELGIAVDGGKDSLSMAAKVGEKVVKAPGTLVVSVYAGCPDISLTVTPDIKHAGRSSLVLVDLSGGHARLGGSALAQTFKQLGDVTPDCDTALLKRAFRATQRLLRERVLLAGHDRSDGGVLTTVLEMCLGGDCGCVMEATTENSVMEYLFNEELGLVVEVDDAKVGEVLAAYEAVQVPARVIAKTQAANRVKVSVKGAVVLDEDEKALHDLWEATSFELDKLQSNPACAEQEQEGLKKRHKPAWKLTYEPRATPAEWLASASKYRVAIIREEGSNGDREMAAAMYAAGFEPWDVHVRDLLSGRITLEGSTLGVWVAHGEGRCFWPDDAVKEEAMRQNCVALKYVDDDGNVTMEYPMNPNGSEGAVVGLTSPDGRHLCMMPHPERLFMKYQWPYWPEEWESPVSPWLKMFQNAREWCERQWRVCCHTFWHE